MKKRQIILFAIVLVLVVGLEAERVESGNIFSDAYDAVESGVSAVGNALGSAGNWVAENTVGRINEGISNLLGQSSRVKTRGVRLEQLPQISAPPVAGHQEFKKPFTVMASNAVDPQFRRIIIPLNGVREVSRIIGYHCIGVSTSIKYTFFKDDIITYYTELPPLGSGEYPSIKCYPSDLQIPQTVLADTVIIENSYGIMGNEPNILNYFTVHASTAPADQTKVISNREQPYTFTGPILIYSTKDNSKEEFSNLASVLRRDLSGTTRDVEVTLCDSSPSLKDKCALTEDNLKKYTQLWIMDTDPSVSLSGASKAISDFNMRGGGLLAAKISSISSKLSGVGSKGNAAVDSLYNFNNNNLPRYTTDKVTNAWVPPSGTKHIYVRNIAEFLEPNPQSSQTFCELKTGVVLENAVWTGSGCCDLTDKEGKNWYYNDAVGVEISGGKKKYEGCWDNKVVESGNYPKDIKNVFNANGQFYACRATVSPVQSQVQGIDLVPTKLTSSSQVAQGGSFTADLIVKNQGSDNSGNFLVRFLLVRSDGQEWLIGAATFPSLGAGQSGMLTRTLSVPRNTPTDTLRLKVLVDPDKKINEVDYSNNEIIDGQVEIVATTSASQITTAAITQTHTQTITPIPTPQPFKVELVQQCSNIKNKDNTDFKVREKVDDKYVDKYVVCNYEGEFKKLPELQKTKQTGWTVDNALKAVQDHEQDTVENCCPANKCFNGFKCVNGYVDKDDSGNKESVFFNPSVKEFFLCNPKQTSVSTLTQTQPTQTLTATPVQTTLAPCVLIEFSHAFTSPQSVSLGEKYAVDCFYKSDIGGCEFESLNPVVVGSSTDKCKVISTEVTHCVSSKIGTFENKCQILPGKKNCCPRTDSAGTITVTSDWDKLFLSSTPRDRTLMTVPTEQTKEEDQKYYCKQQSQCLFERREFSEKSYDGEVDNFDKKEEERPHCIDYGQFIEDKYCNNGQWTSRTKFLIEQLLSYAGSSDFELVCGKAENVLNEFSGEYFGKIGGRIITNNICVLKKEDKVLFGATSNFPINDRNSPLTAVTSRDACDNLQSSIFGEFKECTPTRTVENNLKIFYAPTMNAVIFSPEDLPANTLDKFDSFIKPEFDSVVSAIDNLNTENEELYRTYSHLKRTKFFDTIFYQQKAGKKLFGVLERKDSCTDSECNDFFAGIKYTNTHPLTEGYCTEIKNEIRKATNQESECIAQGTNSIIILLKIEQDAESSMIKIWKDLTQKLRIT